METAQNTCPAGKDCTGCKNCGPCKCTHHKMVPMLIILLGVVFLLGNLQVLTPAAVNVIWPVIIILVGAMKLTSQMKMCKCC